MDRNISDLHHNKVELENKLTYLTDQLVLVQKNVNDLIRNIEDTGTIKIKVCISFKNILLLVIIKN